MGAKALQKTLRSNKHRKLIALIAAVREKRGWAQRDLAARLKRPRSFVGRIEAGERRVDVVEFIEIARTLGANPKRLFAQIVDYRPRGIG